MAKDPAFLFYPGDWNLGTMHFTLLEKGCYIELLVLQFAKGKFTQAQAKHMLNGSFDLAWPTLSEKFNTDGVYYWNERLQFEKEKRQNFAESRRSNASKRKTPKKEDEHMLNHMHTHMESEIENVLILFKSENMVVKKMFKMWQDKNKDYVYHKETDYHALLKIAYYIAEQKGWRLKSVIDENEDNVVKSWALVVNFLSEDTDKFYKKLTLEGISNPKNLQSIQQSMKASKDDSSKSSQLESRRVSQEEYFS